MAIPKDVQQKVAKDAKFLTIEACAVDGLKYAAHEDINRATDALRRSVIALRGPASS